MLTVRTRKALHVALAIVLILGLSPIAHVPAAHAAEPAPPAQTAWSAGDIDDMLSSADYAEGEVIAFVCDAAATTDDSASRNTIAGGTQLSSADAEVAEEALDVDLDATANPAELDAAGENAVRLIHINDPSRTTRAVLEELAGDPSVIYAQPNYVYDAEPDAQDATRTESGPAPSATQTPVVDMTGMQYAFDNANNNALTPAADIPGRLYGFDVGLTRTESGWNRFADDGSPIANATGVVAVIDSGVDYTNPDLSNVVITGMKQLMANTSFADVTGDRGFNASAYVGADPMATDTTDPMDYQGHGTHCAGIVAAEWNGMGTSGAASGVQILPIRCSIGNTGGMSTSAQAAAFQYLDEAVDAGLNLTVTSNSYGAFCYTDNVAAFGAAKLGKKGVVSTFGAGNESQDNDSHATTPSASVQVPTSIVVDSSTADGKKSWFSNYGKTTTTLFAPGSAILSTQTSKTSAYCSVGDATPLALETFRDDASFANIYAFELPQAVQYNWNNVDATEWGIPTTFDELKAKAASMKPGTVTRDAQASIDADSTSLRLDSSKMTQRRGTDPDDLPDDQRKDLTVSQIGMNLTTYIPIPKEDFDEDKISYAGFSLSAHDSCVTSAWVGTLFRLKDSATKTGKPCTVFCRSEYASSGATDSTWTPAGSPLLSFVPLNADGTPDQDYELAVIDGGDTIYMPLSIYLRSNDSAAHSSYYYIDALITSDHSSSWEFRDGTSMATPVVSGLAAVVAKMQQDAGQDIHTPQAAIERANYLKAHIRSVDEFQDLCTQGGLIDLSVADADTTPVVNVPTHDVAAKQVILQGAYFGNEPGSVTANGTTLPVVSWCDTKIVLDASGMDAAELVCRVTKANGKSCNTSVAYETSALLEFPIDIATPDTDPNVGLGAKMTGACGDAKTIMGAESTAVGTHVYAALFDQKAAISSQSVFSIYDTTTDTWSYSPIFDDPSFIYPGRISLAELDGYLYMLLSYPSPDLKFCVYLYKYDPAKMTAESSGLVSTYLLADMEHPSTESGAAFRQMGATLARANKKLLLIGGSDPNVADEEVKENNVSEISFTQVDGQERATLTPKGSLGISLVLARHAEFDGSLYLAGGWHTATKVGMGFPPNLGYSDTLLKLEYDQATDTWKTTDITAALPALDTTRNAKSGESHTLSVATTQSGIGEYAHIYGLTATEDALVVSGYCGQGEVQDTFMLKKGSTTFEPFAVDGQRYTASLQNLYFPLSAYANGTLVTMGMAAYDTAGSSMLARAVQVKDQFTVSFDSQGGTEAAGQVVKPGAAATTPAEPVREGYSFDGWFSDQACAQAYDFATPVTTDITLYAKWTAQPTPPTTAFTVTFETNGGSQVDAQTVKAGEAAAKPADPTREGHTFVGWFADKELTGPYDFATAVNDDITLYAKWETATTPTNNGDDGSSGSGSGDNGSGSGSGDNGSGSGGSSGSGSGEDASKDANKSEGDKAAGQVQSAATPTVTSAPAAANATGAGAATKANTPATSDDTSTDVVVAIALVGAGAAAFAVRRATR